MTDFITYYYYIKKPVFQSIHINVQIHFTLLLYQEWFVVLLNKCLSIKIRKTAVTIIMYI